MKKTVILLLLVVLLGFILASCANEVVTFCPFCRNTSIKEVSDYDLDTGIKVIHYECLNVPSCGKTFGAGLVVL